MKFELKSLMKNRNSFFWGNMKFIEFSPDRFVLFVCVLSFPCNFIFNAIVIASRVKKEMQKQIPLAHTRSIGTHGQKFDHKN